MKHFSSALEALESRIAPAAIFVDASSLKVTFSSAGTLKVAPLVANDSVEFSVEQLPDGDFLISDSFGDADLEEVADFTGNVRAINLALGSGNDSATLALLSETPLRANVTATLGLGEDTFTFSEGVIRGNLSVSAKADASITIGSFDTEADVLGKVSLTQVGGTAVLDDIYVGAVTATGASSFEISGTVIGQVIVTAKTSASIALGTENATLQVGRDIIINGSVDTDDVILSNINVNGALRVALNTGDNTLLTGGNIFVGGVTSITAKGGDDSITLGSNFSTFVSNGRFTANLGEAVTGNSLNVEEGLFFAGLSFTGGNGNDAVNLGNVGIFNDLVIAARGGDNTVTIESLTNAGKFSYTGGTGVDNLTINDLGFGFVVGSVNLGEGDDIITIDVTDEFLTFSVNGNLGTDTVNLIDPTEDFLLVAVFKNIEIGLI